MNEITSKEIAEELSIELKEVFEKAQSFDRMYETLRSTDISFCHFAHDNPNETRIETIFNGLIKQEKLRQ